MDLIALLQEMNNSGISSYVAIFIALVVVRYWFSEMRRDISKEIDDKIGGLKTDLVQLIQENRHEITATRTFSQQEFISVREHSEQSHQNLRQEMIVAREHSEQSHQNLRQEMIAAREYSEQSHQNLRQEIIAAREYSEQSHQNLRQEIIATRTYSEQSNKEIMLHLIDVRERLANIEGRLGLPTPRMSGVSPPLETPRETPIETSVEMPGAQS